MSATSGYFVAGSSWLHRRNPLTKLLALGLVLLAAFLLPPVVLPVLAVAILAAAWTAGLLRPLLRAMRIPALLLFSILVVNSLFFPAAKDILASLGPLAITREGVTFGLISAGRVLVAFLASVTFLFTTLADDLLETLISARRELPHRIRRAVGGPARPADAVARRRDPRGAAGPWAVARGFLRAAHPVARPAHRTRPARARSWTRASARSRWRPAGSGRDQGGPPIGSSPTHRSIDGCAWRSSSPRS